VLGANGVGWTSDVIAGIDYCLDPDNNPETDDAVDIINMSLGGEPSTDDPLESVVTNATKSGVLCVIAAGNSGYGRYGTIGSPGTSETALTVGACDSTNSIAYFSSLGPDPIHSFIKPEVVAPGVDILSTILHNQTASWSGTSMATPHVTGVAALLKQEHLSWTPEEIKAAIINSAHSAGDSVSVFAQGKGCVDALDAANTRMVVEPGVVSFGYVDLASSVWKDTVKLIVKNFRNVSQNTQINIFDGVPTGVTMTFDKTSFSLAPGEETTISAVLTVPSSVPVLSTEPFAYLGKIKVTSDSDNVIVPFSFIKSTTLVITFDLQPNMLWLVDRTGGTIKVVSLQEGATKYIIPISQGYSLDLLASLHQDTLGVRNYYLVHHIIDNPTGLTYVLVSHDEATINMANDTIYDIHNNRVNVDSSTTVDVSFQIVVYDERSGQYKNYSNYEYAWDFPINMWRLFFPPLDSLFFIKKSIIVSQNSDNYILRKSIFGLHTWQDINIATGTDNLFGYHVTSSYDDPCQARPSDCKKYIILGINTLRSDQGGWEDEGTGFRFPTIKGNFFFNKQGTNQAENDKYLYSYMYLGASYAQISYDSTFEPPPILRTPGFTINEKGEAIFEQMRIIMPPLRSPLPAEISSEYIYEALKSGDTIMVEQYAHVNFPDYMTYLKNGSVFMKCNNDMYDAWSSVSGGIKQYNGVIEDRSVFNSYWNMPLFTPQVFAHNRAQINIKPFTRGEQFLYTDDDIRFAYYKFDNMKNNVGTLQVLSDVHPYTILGQAGLCTADCEYQIPSNSNNETVFPSFNLLQVAVDGKAVDVVRPDQNGRIRLVIFDSDSSVTSVKLSLLLVSGDEIELPVSSISRHEYVTSIPTYIPKGFIDVIAKIKDTKGNACELNASPAFFFGSPMDSVRLDARIRMTSYSLNNIDTINFHTSDTLKYTLSYINYGNNTARNVVVMFPTTSYFKPIGTQSWTKDSLGANDTIHIPVNLVFQGKQQTVDEQTYYSPSVTWTSNGTTYLRKYNVLVDFQNIITNVVQTENMVPNKFELHQNYPNPFNPTTTIRFSLKTKSFVSLKVYDILGRQVTTLVNEEMSAGNFSRIWNAANISSGIYFYRLQAGSFMDTKKLVLLK
jgi:hypothetical protein